MSSVDDQSLLVSLALDSPMYLGRHLDVLRRFAAANPVEAGLIINALVGGMVQSNAHAFMRGLGSEPPRSMRPDDLSPRTARTDEVVRSVPPPGRSAAPRSMPPRPSSDAPFTAAMNAPHEATMPYSLAASPPVGAPDPPDLEVGDQVQHRWLGVGIVERIWWRDDHWHVATDRFGAPASRLKKIAER